MDASDIARVVRDYAEAAYRCQQGGLDGVETVTGGHLIGQFFSPRTNRRTDAFGGATENRARFALLVHEAIRKRVGDDFLVGIRFVVDEAIEDGIDFDECVRLAQLLESAGHIDFFNGIYGCMDTDLALAEHNMPGMSQPLTPFLRQVGQFKRATKLPVFHAARIPDLASARYAIAEGLLDMVGMTRAHIADPQLVNKLARETPSVPAIRQLLGDMELTVVDWSEDLAYLSAEFTQFNKSHGLSHGDRACLTLAKQLHATAVTSDRTWRRLPSLGVRVIIFR